LSVTILVMVSSICRSCGVGGQGQARGPGQQVCGECGDGQPDAVLVGVVEGEVAQAGVLGCADPVLDPGVAAMA
jgi:hypothetical protein